MAQALGCGETEWGDEMSDADEKQAEGAAPKPIHFFWAVAALAWLVSVWQDLSVISGRTQHDNTSSPFEPALSHYSLIYGQAVRTVLLSAAAYFGAALTIELIDRVRWLLLSDGERSRQGGRYILRRLAR